MKRDALRVVVAAAVILGFGGGTARGIEVRPLAKPAATDQAAQSKVVSTYRVGSVLSDAVGVEPAGDAADDQGSLVAAATDGTYDGTLAGQPFTLTVSSNKITGWTVHNLVCPSFTVVQSGVSLSCNIAGNNTFTCGGLGCSSSGNMKISGSFSGNTVSGTFDADFQPPSLGCCSFRNLVFSATRAGGSAPAAPSNLVATAVSDDEVELDWQDNANNETEFRVEAREGTSGSFIDLGSIAANATGASVTGLDPATLYQFRVRAHNGNGYSAYSNTASATTLGGSAGPCVANATTLCLSGGRFQVRATYSTAQPQSGQAQAVELTPDTGYLWFFSDTNVEAVVKVINACGFNNRFWVFAGGLTDVEVIMTVTDTQTGAARTYTNPLGTKFAPIQDTNAFATCP